MQRKLHNRANKISSTILKSSTRHRILYMLGLVVAGEAVFALPFQITRFFRPTVLDVFGLTNTELGTVQAAYGIVAMLAYFPGGPLADRFSARGLLAVSLFSTAAGGLYLATLPGFTGALLVWGFFGLTTILLLWAALIRATREWGSDHTQGRAFGLLDGGRGVFSAGLVSLAAWLFAHLFPEGIVAAEMADREAALRTVILGYSAVTALAGVFVWFALANSGDATKRHFEQWNPRTEGLGNHILRALRIPEVWLISLVVVCAYVAYKGFENFSLFAVEIYGLNQVESAQLAALGAWMRPVGALGLGLLGDRYQVTRMTALCFVALLASQLFLALSTPVPGAAWILLSNILVGSLAMFGLRSLYFALLEDARIPAAITGTAVGIISVVGYSPDVFVSYVGGVMLDRSPGLEGHQHYFWFLASFAALGLLTSLVLMRRLAPKRTL
ncbi:MAG TPA: MFS transporter [Xanthomonadales bacterium]|nr:MFS transporter [Xanthomonadales bacterium]